MPAGIGGRSQTRSAPPADEKKPTAPQIVPTGRLEVVGGNAPFNPLHDRLQPNQRFEKLGLGDWLGVSGAAFTTGLGFRTSMALSLLAGLANVRLGYWWDSGVEPASRLDSAQLALGRRLGMFFGTFYSVQSYLVDEFLGRFHGPTRRRWYLSDGGHFENTGCYELIRRRVPVIIVCDCGADPEYKFEDIANLVRKARTDFDAEIVFADQHASDHGQRSGPTVQHRPRPFGPLDGLRRVNVKGELGPSRSSCHATVAKVYYRDGGHRPEMAGSTILFLKPTLTGDEPRDVINYAETHPSFPQESTLDQFFDEAQWESYRRLGEHVADACLDAKKWEDLRDGRLDQA
jgi:hypothetical protein